MTGNALAAPREKNIAEVSQALEIARGAYDDAVRSEDIARKRTTTCLNDLNDKMKQFDEVVAKIKKDAPRATNWAQQTPPRF